MGGNEFIKDDVSYIRGNEFIKNEEFYIGKEIEILNFQFIPYGLFTFNQVRDLNNEKILIFLDNEGKVNEIKLSEEFVFKIVND